MVENLTKVYPLYKNPQDRFKEALHPWRKKYHKDFYALQDVSFSVEKGDSLGIIGQNGSGKSTLLKILSRVLTPTSGNFQIRGRVISLLELGSGFNPDLTGLENIYFYGTILGFSKKKIEARLDEIIAFADIGQFIFQPLKTYSSGMRSRLAFSVASHVDPDILILDEVLAVGDLRFKQKCLRVMRDIIDQNRTVIFVSHSMSAINNFCNNVIWLHEGKLRDMGTTGDIVKKYTSFMTYGLETQKPALSKANQQKSSHNEKKPGALTTQGLKWLDTKKFDAFGQYGATIEKIALHLKETGEKVVSLKGGEWLSLYTQIKVKEMINSPGLGLKLNDKRGNGIFTVNNYLYQKPLRPLEAGEVMVIRTDFRMPFLLSGKYPLSIALSDGTQHSHVQHHWIHDALIITVDNKNPMFNKGANLIVVEPENYKIELVPR